MIRLATLLLMGLSLVACQGDEVTTPTPTPGPGVVPAELAAPAGNAEFLRATGRGVQIYTCQQVGGAAPAWSLTAPDAVLENASGFVASHGAGPNWTAPDGSSILGSKLAEVPSPDANSVPWLLVKAETRGQGLLSNATFVQRLDTAGGVAPASGCSAETLGEETRTAYSATYVFLEPTSAISQTITQGVK